MKTYKRRTIFDALLMRVGLVRVADYECMCKAYESETSKRFTTQQKLADLDRVYQDTCHWLDVAEHHLEVQRGYSKRLLGQRNMYRNILGQRNMLKAKQGDAS